MMNAEQKATMDALNRDLSLDDLKVWWTGQTVRLQQGNRVCAMFSATGDLQEKILRWCLKSHYRCTQLHDGRIWL